MAFHRGPSIVKDGLVLSLDAANVKSYVSGSTTWRDLSGNNNSGSLTNGPTFSSANGGSIVFDGTNDYVSFTNSSSLQNSTGTYTTWVKANSLNPGINIVNRFFVRYNGWNTGNGSIVGSFRYNNSKWYIELTYPNGSATTLYGTSEISINTWYNISFLYDGSNYSIYLNGKIESSVAKTGNTFVSNNLSLGQDSFGNFFTGNMSHFQIYNRALSALEVQQNFNALKGRYGI